MSAKVASIARPPRIGGVVLAAGASQRLGRPKQMLSLRGEPLVTTIAGILVAAPSVGEVSVITGSGHDAVEAAVARLDVEIVPNTAWNEGIASSVRSAARWATRIGMEGLLITLVDQVRLDVAHVEALVSAFCRDDSLAAASGYGGTVGVPALFGAQTFDALLALEGDRGAGALLRALDTRVAVVPWEDGLIDLDTTADIERVGALR